MEMVDPKFFKLEFNYDAFLQHMLSDKKNNGDNICFILLEEIGTTKFIFKTLEEIYNPLKVIIEELFY